MGKELARRRPSPAQKAVEERIRVIRGKQVVLDSDLAAFYGVETRRLTEQMKRNEERFPEDFVFQLSEEEMDALRSQDATSKPGRGGRRYRPYAFTEQGALQASSVLRSAKAAEVSVAVARAFVAMRAQLHAIEGLPATIAEIQNKLDELEASDADLNAKVETMAEGLKAIRQALKALNRAEKQVPQLEKGPSPLRRVGRRRLDLLFIRLEELRVATMSGDHWSR
jgi:exonuclease VII small subunit